LLKVLGKINKMLALKNKIELFWK